MTVAGTQTPFDRVWAAVMPAGSHGRDMGRNCTGAQRSAVCAVAIPVTAWKRVHLTVEQGGRPTESPRYTHRARAARAPRVVLPPKGGGGGGYYVKE